MNGKRRTAAFKQKVAIEALKGDRTINEIAKDYGVHPVQVSQWKKELVEGAELLFGKRKRKDSDTEVEKAALERKVGQLTIEIDWLKKNSGFSFRRSLGPCRSRRPGTLSLAHQCRLLRLNRSSYYLEPTEETAYNLKLMNLIDQELYSSPILWQSSYDGLVMCPGIYCE
jgi:putative transposase